MESDYGNQFARASGDEPHFIAFIDNSTDKQGNMIHGLPCISLENVVIEEDVGVIITMSQIA